MMFFLFLICVKVVLLGAFYGRLDGGGFVKTAEWIERSLIMFFFVLACAPFAGLWALGAYIGVAGIATGHGQYFLARAWKKIEPEFFDPIVSLFFGPDIRTTPDFDPQTTHPKHEKKLYWRCVFGMFVTGTIVGLPAFAISMAFGQALGALFLLTGVVKALSYIIGWEVFKSTVPAEYMNGGGRNIICLAVIIIFLTSVL